MAEQNQRYKDLTQNQIEWIAIQKKILKASPLPYIPPKSGYRFRILNLIRDKKYKKLVIFTLTLNIIALGLYHDGATADFITIINLIEYYVTAFYITEFLMKSSCYGIVGYFYTRSFLLEFVILMGYLTEFFMNLMDNIGNVNDVFSDFHILIKCIKLLTIFRFFGYLKALKSIIRNLGFSISILANLLYLMLIVFFIYSTIGFYLFKDLKSGVIIDDRINFTNVLSGMMTLFKCMTCDNWIDIMYDIINGNCKYCGTGYIYA